MKYKNCARVSRTYYGITIKPNEVKDFPGYVNDKNFLPVKETSQPQSKRPGRPKGSTNSTKKVETTSVKEPAKEQETTVVEEKTNCEISGGES